MNAEVEAYRYVTEGTFDAYLYQLVEGKQRFIAQVMTSKSPFAQPPTLTRRRFPTPSSKRSPRETRSSRSAWASMSRCPACGC